LVMGFWISQSLRGNTAIAAAVAREEVDRVAVPARHGRGDVALVRPIRRSRSLANLHLRVARASALVLAALTARRRGLGGLEGDRAARVVCSGCRGRDRAVEVSGRLEWPLVI
jgi:hypothetical protein